MKRSSSSYVERINPRHSIYPSTRLVAPHLRRLSAKPGTSSLLPPLGFWLALAASVGKEVPEIRARKPAGNF